MAGIQPLVTTQELKTNILKEHASGARHLVYTYYDQEFDALTIMLVPPDSETVVHYIDDHVALLYEPATMEIVGLQVEAFERSFLPAHEGVRRVWRLAETEAALEDAGDILLAAERLKSRVSCEVARATQNVLGEPGNALARALTCA